MSSAQERGGASVGKRDFDFGRGEHEIAVAVTGESLSLSSSLRGVVSEWRRYVRACVLRRRDGSWRALFDDIFFTVFWMFLS